MFLVGLRQELSTLSCSVETFVDEWNDAKMYVMLHAGTVLSRLVSRSCAVLLQIFVVPRFSPKQVQSDNNCIIFLPQQVCLLILQDQVYDENDYQLPLCYTNVSITCLVMLGDLILLVIE